MLTSLSLGAGVQSSCLALRAATGETERAPDCAIFADTQAEPASVYKWLDWLEQEIASSPRPFPVYRVTAGSLTERVTQNRVNRKTGKLYFSNMIPAFAKNPDGSKGIVGRSCTTNFKIIPITQKLRALIGRPAFTEWRRTHKDALKAIREHAEAKKAKRPHPYPRDAWAECQGDPLAVQWIGISLDEATRMKPSRDPWARHEWPLVDARMSRHDCMRWMSKKGYPTPPRSACVYCPFHSDAEWRRLKQIEPEDFQIAVDAEKAMQRCHAAVTTPGKMQGIAFLHASLVPLDEVDFSTDEEHGQQSLFNAECEGMCGI